MGELPLGALVRWASAPGTPIGVIVQKEGSRLKVRFDDDAEPKIFNAGAGAIQRVELEGTVQRASTGDVGLVRTQVTPVPPRWQVILGGKMLTVAEADLRPHVLDDPQSRILDGRLGSARQFALAATARRYELEHLTNDLVSLGAARVDIKPHQVSVAHRVVSNYPHRFLLCDEVGLGKTIETGMVLKELRSRGAAERVIVIAPPNLVRQWQFELKSKFNEAFSIINSDTVKYLRATQGMDDNPFEVYDSVIVSSAWISQERWAKLAVQAPWDMVVLDEAHHARVRRSGTRETGLYKVIRQLASPDAFSKRSALFLTATPMQLDSGELYSLIELLDPALFPTELHFDQHRSQLTGLSKLVHELTVHGFPLPEEEAATTVDRIAGWLDLDLATAEGRLRAGRQSVADVCTDLSARHLLSEVLIRNRKKIVGGFMPRHAHRWEVELSAAERTALDAVELYVRDGYSRAERTKDTAAGFVMVIFQKLMASSIRALRTSLDRRRKRLEEQAKSPSTTKQGKATLAELEADLEDDAYVSAVLGDIAAADTQEAEELARLVDLLDQVPSDSKAETLVAQLREIEKFDPAAKVLLFTEFRETQEHLKERVESIGWEVQLFHGQMKPGAKDASVEAFRSSSRPSILLSTEAGGEGRNFQFCHLLVNYDLPWNPMRVEQRIGRVDRIGQTSPVEVFNFWVKGTIEERVLNVLERRINIFEETVGGLDPILGDAERDLTKIFQLGGKKRDDALQTFEEDLERKIIAARDAEEKLRDFIMETKSYSQEIASMLTAQTSPIGPAQQELFVSRLLADVRTYLDRQPDGTFEITFHEPFLSDFPAHAKEGMKKRRVALRPDVKPDSEDVEYFAMGHPVVDDLIARATGNTYPGTAAAFEVDDLPGVDPTSGWLIVYELGVPALKEVRRLLPLFVSDDGEVNGDLGQQLVERAGRFPNDAAITPADIPGDGLDSALIAAGPAAYAALADLEGAALAESARQIERERAKMANYFGYREQAAGDRLAGSKRMLAGFEASEEADKQRIIPAWRGRVAHDERLIEELAGERARQLAQLEHRAAGSGDLRLFAIARVEIIGDGPT